MGRRELLELLERHGIEPSRALGQNFMVDPNTIDRIVRLAGVVAGDRVLEIGAGAGSLSVALADAGASLVVVELDRHVLPALREVMAGRPVEVVEGDVMRLDLVSMLERVDAGPWKVVANLPYNIATTLVLDILAGVPAVTELTVVVQAEVAERLAAGPGNRVYGIPSVKRALDADAQVLGRVPPTVFHPRPRVDSAVLRLVRHPAPAVDRPVFDRLVDRAFGQRRKMLRRSLVGLVGDDEFAGVGIDPTTRPEQLAVDDFVRLADIVSSRERSS